MAFVVPPNTADKKWKDNQNVVAYIIELVTVDARARNPVLDDVTGVAVLRSMT